MEGKDNKCDFFFLASFGFPVPTISVPDISARVISARMFHHGNISAHAPFGAVDVPADGLFNTGMFRHGVFSARGIFGTRNFQHLNISAQGYFGT